MILERDVPVLAAPMAGGISTPELVAAVGSAGGFGFLAAGYATKSAVAEQVLETRKHTEDFGVNLFVPGPRSGADLGPYRERIAAQAARFGARAGEPVWNDDEYAAKVDLVVAERVPVVSFTFGCPDESTVDRLHDVDTEVVVTVTTPEEAQQAARAGADMLCVQGAEAGGHRGCFTDDAVSAGGGPLYGLLPALRAVRAEVDLPLIAAGGLVRGEDVAGVLSAGAVAAQLGTAFLVCDEAGTGPAQRAEIAAGERETVLTRSFTGRPARGLRNRFIDENEAFAPAAYPEINQLTKPLRAAASAEGDPEALSLWAGQAYRQARAMPAADLVRRLRDEARDAMAQARTRL
ncbi:nitronate monooxygenase [Saccharopolyspora sp. HNM0983]|uniref:Propionate 3-nitronate monooxygenase n=1 Tax=Saccharopolyspora montiporae TaxID=2781240 RepID=A0A929BBB7_9PSEU|nr:nitronate monooxygenase [Saccharopolyspora sp. HNM0983]MBE9374538.1 nitronate monooxygenase [Saccharopolyspora sp. HNM0983]